MTHTANRSIAWWLLSCALLVYAMVVLGGVTRLTHSGLSMVQWHPIAGVVPPMSHSAWQAEFDNYKKYPEYKDINEGMTLSGFKSIFWLEYFHRLLGRLIGFVFFLPFLYFLVRKKITRKLVPKLVVMFVLGGLQGLLGWYMVSSGLHKAPHVSAYRLTAHLSTAIVIYAYIVWVALGLLWPGEDVAKGAVKPLRRAAGALTALVFVMMMSGAFVAGTRAGFAYNTWPDMAGHFVPPGFFALHPWWRNFFENIGTVQFDHRMIAYLLCIAVPALLFYARRFELPVRTRRALWLLLAMLVVQVGLGLATLLYVVPVALGALHQAGAVMLFTLALFVTRSLWPLQVAEPQASPAQTQAMPEPSSRAAS